MSIFGFIISSIDESYYNEQYNNQNRHLRPREGMPYYGGRLNYRAQYIRE